MYDNVRVYFDDGTNALIHVHEDADIQDVIAELCEIEGWNLSSVINFEIVHYSSMDKALQ